jgi:hypothetical protein
VPEPVAAPAVATTKRSTRQTVVQTPTAPCVEFSKGQLVWVKCGNYPLWPARISQMINSLPDNHSVRVDFFPDACCGWIC